MTNPIIHTDDNGLSVSAVPLVPAASGFMYSVKMPARAEGASPTNVTLTFQNGPVPQNGVNGLTNEALLAIVVHRLKFLDSQFPSRFNRAAINGASSALYALEQRTADRQARGVTGQQVL